MHCCTKQAPFQRAYHLAIQIQKRSKPGSDQTQAEGAFSLSIKAQL